MGTVRNIKSQLTRRMIPLSKFNFLVCRFADSLTSSSIQLHLKN
jgi:hypothetical protein